MSEAIIQKLTKKLTEGVKVDIPVVSPAQECVGEVATFLRKYSTNGTIPLATFISFITFTVSYFTGFVLVSAKNRSVYGYIITAPILSSIFILSLILNSWYRTIAKSEKTGNELLNSDLNKDDKGGIDKIKIILDFKKGRILEYVVPVDFSQIDELRQQTKENNYRVLLLSTPTLIPILTLLGMLIANKFNIENPYIGILALILLFSVLFVKLGFTLCKIKRMNDYTFPQFGNKDMLLNFGGKSLKRMIINEQFKKQDIDKKEDKKVVEDNEDVDRDPDEKEKCSTPITRSSSIDTMYSANTDDIKNELVITKDEQEESKSSWWNGIGGALGGKIAQPIGQAACAIDRTCKDISKAAQRVEQMGCNISELKEPIKQMCEDVSSAATQLRQTSKDVSKTTVQIRQTFTEASRFIKKLESYLPNENNNTHLEMPLEDILPILKSKLKAKNESGDLDDTIDNLVDGKVVVIYKKGSTLEFTIPAKRAEAKEKIGCFTELRVEDLKMTVGKDGFVFDSKI